VVIRRAGVTDLAEVERVARATWLVDYAGIIPDEIQRRLLDNVLPLGYELDLVEYRRLIPGARARQ